MRKRVRLARAMAPGLDILFFDEPSAGLDPTSARLLDDLILELRACLGTTFVVVAHELASIFTIGNYSMFLDAERKTMIAAGDPKQMLVVCRDPKVHRFLTRGGPPPAKETGQAMSKQTKKTLIGVFVMIEAALSVAAVLILDSGTLFEQKHNGSSFL